MFCLTRKVKQAAIILLWGLLIVSRSLADSPIAVRVETLHEEYDNGDRARMNLVIENLSNNPIYGVNIEHILPEGLEYVEEPDFSVIEKIPAQSSYERAFLVKQSAQRMEVTVTANKEQYGNNEVAKLTVRVRNKLGHAVSNVSITHFLPEELAYAQDCASLLIEHLPANGTIEQTYYVAKTFDGLIITIQADKKHYRDDEIAELTIRLTNKANKQIENVSIEHILPNGLQYADKKDAYLFNHMTIGANETVEHVVRVRIMDALPETGDASRFVLVVYMLLLMTSVLLMACVKKHNRRWNEGAE